MSGSDVVVVVLIIGASVAVLVWARSRACKHKPLRGMDSGLAECPTCSEIVRWDEVNWR